MQGINNKITMVNLMADERNKDLVKKQHVPIIPFYDVVSIEGVATYYGVSEALLRVLQAKYRCVFENYTRTLIPADLKRIATSVQKAHDMKYYRFGFKNGTRVYVSNQGNTFYSMKGLILFGALLEEDMFSGVGNGNARRVWEELDAMYHRVFDQKPKQVRRRRAEKREPVSVTVETTVTVNDGHSRKARPVEQVSGDGVVINIFASGSAASKETGIDNTCISNCCRGKQKTAGGYVWRFAV
jgi:hypothetical protein